MELIYIYRNNLQEGPFSLKTVKALVKIGEINLENLAWRDGCTDWIPLREILNVAKTSINVYENPEFSELKKKTAKCLSELAEAEAIFSLQKHKVDSLRAELFKSLKKLYKERDRLRLVVQYRRDFLDQNIKPDSNAAKSAENQFKKATEDSEKSYEEAFQKLSKKKPLTEEEEADLRMLWKQLVKLFHPDLVHDDPEKAETFHKLTQGINQAKAAGDLETLKEIAADPEAFLRKQGWASVDLGESEDLETLKARLEMLLKQIDEVRIATEELLASDDYKLLQLCQADDSVLKSVTEKQRQQLEDECAHLRVEADELQNQIRAVTGNDEPLIK
jgi:DNA polymerase-3 subunit epsilon